MFGLIIFLAIFGYFFYTRIWAVYSRINYYKKQGVPFHDGIYPIFGSYIGIMKYRVKEGEDSKPHPFNEFLEQNYF